MKRNLTCIICPIGCALTADICGETVSVTGNACPKGAQYAQNECLHPVRTVTTTLRISNRHDTMVSVKTQNPVPKEKMAEVVQTIRQCTVQAPVAVGQVVLEGVYGTNVVITKAVD